jgi:hypothetical protein
MISRRHLLRSAAIAPALAVPAMAISAAASPAASQLPPVLPYARIPTSDLVLIGAECEYMVLELAIPDTDEQCTRICERMGQLEAQMTACVASSLSGLHAKARLLKRMLDTDLCGDEGDDIQSLTLSLIDDIRRAEAVERFEAECSEPTEA